MKIFGIIVLLALVFWVVAEIVKSFRSKKPSTSCCETPVRPAIVPTASLKPATKVVVKKAVAKKKATTKKATKK